MAFSFDSLKGIVKKLNPEEVKESCGFKLGDIVNIDKRWAEQRKEKPELTISPRAGYKIISFSKDKKHCTLVLEYPTGWTESKISNVPLSALRKKIIS
jgi:hypothetical protein